MLLIDQSAHNQIKSVLFAAALRIPHLNCFWFNLHYLGQIYDFGQAPFSASLEFLVQEHALREI